MTLETSFRLSNEYSRQLDQADPLRELRKEFYIPKHGVYLCGNSLGLQPVGTRTLVLEELEVWKQQGVTGHFDHPHGRPWVSMDEQVTAKMANVVGALPSEIAVMGSLTANLHLLMASFYRPKGERTKIIIEEKAFPSDHVCRVACATC